MRKIIVFSFLICLLFSYTQTLSSQNKCVKIKTLEDKAIDIIYKLPEVVSLEKQLKKNKLHVSMMTDEVTKKYVVISVSEDRPERSTKIYSYKYDIQGNLYKYDILNNNYKLINVTKVIKNK